VHPQAVPMLFQGIRYQFSKSHAASGWTPARLIVRAAYSAFAKGVEGPAIVFFIVTEDIQTAITGPYFEIAHRRAVPLVLNLYNFQQLFSQSESQRALVCLIPGIAFHLDIAHFGPFFLARG
jgi:hypothetical protein